MDPGLTRPGGGGRVPRGAGDEWGRMQLWGEVIRGGRNHGSQREKGGDTCSTLVTTPGCIWLPGTLLCVIS